MAHSRLKATGVILIIYGAGNILGGLAILVASLLAGGEISGMLETYLGMSDTTAGAILLLLAVLYLVLAVPDFIAGISGIRFANGKGNIKLCQIPSGVVIVIYGLDAIIKIFSGNFSNMVGALIHAAVAVLCIVYSKKVEEASVGNLMLDDTPLFRYKDE